jgi:hypothetical protein
MGSGHPAIEKCTDYRLFSEGGVCIREEYMLLPLVILGKNGSPGCREYGLG